MIECEITDKWYTPGYVWKAVDIFFDKGAWHDPCPAHPVQDGLTANWWKDCYINPPYSKALKRAFIKKGKEQFSAGKRFLWLVNYANSVDCEELSDRASAVCIPYRRIAFVPGDPSLGDGRSPRYDNIFYLWGDPAGFAEAFGEIGKTYVSMDKKDRNYEIGNC